MFQKFYIRKKDTNRRVHFKVYRTRVTRNKFIKTKHLVIYNKNKKLWTCDCTFDTNYSKNKKLCMHIQECMKRIGGKEDV